jgi:hypothetical protein
MTLYTIVSELWRSRRPGHKAWWLLAVSMYPGACTCVHMSVNTKSMRSFGVHADTPGHGGLFRKRICT